MKKSKPILPLKSRFAIACRSGIAVAAGLGSLFFIYQAYHSNQKFFTQIMVAGTLMALMVSFFNGKEAMNDIINEINYKKKLRSPEGIEELMKDIKDHAKGRSDEKFKNAADFFSKFLHDASGTQDVDEAIILEVFKDKRNTLINLHNDVFEKQMRPLVFGAIFGVITMRTGNACAAGGGNIYLIASLSSACLFAVLSVLSFSWNFNTERISNFKEVKEAQNHLDQYFSRSRSNTPAPSGPT